MITITSTGDTDADKKYTIVADEKDLRALYHGVEFTLKDLRDNKDVIIEVTGQQAWDTMVAYNTALKDELAAGYLRAS
jgi:hypothetical protein